MSIEMKQDGLFQDPLGLRLTLAREAAGLTPEGVAKQLRIPKVIVEAMEREDWQRLGAPVYVRAHLSAYLSLLDLPATLVEGPASQKPAPRLAAMDSRSRLQGIVEKATRQAVYLVMTAVIVVPVVWLATHYDDRQKLVAAISLEPDVISRIDESPERTQVQLDPVSQARPEVDPARPALDLLALEGTVGLEGPLLGDNDIPSQPPAAKAPTPVVASLAAFPRDEDGAEAGPAAGLLLEFQGDSWLEVVAEDGKRLEWGLISAGQQRRFPAGRSLKVTLGNADAVAVTHDGKTLDLAPYRSANVARFAVSSASDVIPAGH